MKPIRLTMRAFGSYGKKTVIDFTGSRQNLFLVTGDTGAGKTTVFDAICYALYGEASSEQNKKTGQELVSQFAEAGTEPYVELEFSEAVSGEEQIYCVRRVPSYYKKKERGSGLKSKPETEKVTLVMPDGSVYPAKETNKKLEEITGLSKSQFMQIGMIAQGEFMDLLRAKSDEKKVIFRKLFGTELYQNIVEQLEKKAGEKNAAYEHIKTACRTLISQIDLSDADGSVERMERIRQLQILKEAVEKTSDLTMTEQMLTTLENLCRDVEKDRVTALEQKAQAKKQLDTAGEACTRGETLLASFHSLADAEKNLKECEEETEAIAEKKLLANRIPTAYELSEAERIVQNAIEQFEKTERQLQELQARIPDLKKKAESAAEVEEKARRDYERQTSETAAVREKVQKAKQLYEQIHTAEKQLKQSRRELSVSSEKRKVLEKEWEEFEKNIADWRMEAAGLQDANTEMLRWEQEEKEIAEEEKTFSEVRKAFDDLSVLKKKAEAAARKYQTARDQYEESRTVFANYNRAYLDAQAGLLAGQLEEGLPCPVCGSIHHPNPCQISEEYKSLTREELDRLDLEVRDLNAAATKLSEAAGKAMQQFKEREELTEAMRSSLENRLKAAGGDISVDASLEQMKLFILNRQSEHRNKEGFLRNRVNRWNVLQLSLSGEQDEREQRSRGLEAVREAEKEASDAAVRFEQALDTLLRQQEFSSEKAAQEILNQQEHLLGELDQARKYAEVQAKQARSESENTETRLKTCKKDLPELEKKWKEEQEHYLSLLKERKMTEGQWKEILTVYPKSAVEEIQKEIDIYQMKKAAAEGRKEAALSAIAEQEKPDLVKLEENKVLADSVYRQTEERYSALNHFLEVNCRILRSLEKLLEEGGAAAGEAARIQSLHRKLAGKESGFRMDIETYVQRYYLKRILQAANRHFFRMSAGQYELGMVEESEAGQGKNRGLDLTVYSNITGQTRGIRTLSGGESFMAALAMALGMADQIQEKSAAVNLDIMFIDEGFGSLDDHSRSQAVKVLQEMAMGSRLIGIISHVSELKQEIDDQLIITKDDEGSHARWQLS